MLAWGSDRACRGRNDCRAKRDAWCSVGDCCRLIESPVVGNLERPDDRLVLAIDAGRVAALPAVDRPPELAPSAGCATAMRASHLLGRDLFGNNGIRIGKVSDSVIAMNRARVHFAVIGFDPSPGRPTRCWHSRSSCSSRPATAGWCSR